MLEFRLMILALFVVFAGCGEPLEKEPVNAFPNSSSPNAGSTSVTLVLRNNTDVPIWIDGNCEATWYQLRDANGEIVRPSPGCSSCLCGVEDCAVCGQCPAAAPVVVNPGEELDWTWQGIYWTSSSDQFRETCLAQQQYASGTFAAEFCYGFGTDGSNFTDGGCFAESFEFGSDSQVIHVPTPPQPMEPGCDLADSDGLFPNCDACGDDCDQIDAPGLSGFACGCSTGGCPCGLRCGSIELGPGITTGNVCVR